MVINMEGYYMNMAEKYMYPASHRVNKEIRSLNMETRKNNWSILGFGCMRFPTGKGHRINMKETERELAYAIRHGINYFDTAYVYQGSEKVLGILIEKKSLAEKD